MSSLPFFEWCEATILGQTIRESLWLFPVIEAIHLVAFAILGGTVLLVNLRLLGLAFRSQPIGRLAKDARPWQNASLALALATGSLLFLSEPMKLYYSFPFWVKITCLVPAIGSSLILRRTSTSEDGRGPRFGSRLTAFVSLALWAGVAWGGRWIGFTG
jgi:hypothetical protein